MATKKYNINNQEEAIKYFITQMDIEMIEAFLDAKKTYQDMQKDRFLSKLERVFQIFKESEDSALIPYQGRCNNCFKDKIGFTFVGNYSFNYISIIVDAEKGTINDMFECSDFINKDQSLLLNKKLYIDEFVFDSLSKLKE
jgi:hypothetical protein